MKIKQVVKAKLCQENTNNQAINQLIEEATVPEGFVVNSRGVAEINEDGKKHTISKQPLVAVAYVRDNQHDNWGTLLKWVNQDGIVREKVFPNRMLDEGHELMRILSDSGYKVRSEVRKEFREYLARLEPKKRLRLAKKMGWHNTTDGSQAFIWHDEIIGSCDHPHEPVYFLPNQHSPTVESMKKSGSFENWQKKIASAASGNPILVFCLCTAFAGPLMKFVSAESGGFHLCGESSKGKTTAVQVAASVWGNGVAPTNSSSPSFICTWRTTANALEGIAAAHNHSLLILDELGQCDATDFQRVVYDLAAGQGKARMQPDATLSSIRQWQIIYLSTGEVSAKTRMESNSSNSKAKAGQMLRLMDIPISEGIIQDSHGKTATDFVDTLKSDCAAHYGWAGPKFVQGIIDEYNIDYLVGMMRNYKEYFIQNSNVRETEQQRAITRFAFICMAGHLACDLKILPLTHIEIEEAIFYAIKIWLRSSPHLNDAARAVVYLRDFISKNKARFQVNGHDVPPNNMAGYVFRLKSETLYLFNDAAFCEACQKVNTEAVCNELKKLKLLHLNNPGKNKARFLLRGCDNKESFYAVKASILESAFDDHEDQQRTGTDNA